MIIYYMTIIIIILVFIVELESINVCFILKPCAVSFPNSDSRHIYVVAFVLIFIVKTDKKCLHLVHRYYIPAPWAGSLSDDAV